MLDLSVLNDKDFLALVESFGLIPQEDEDEGTVIFYIDGMEDYILQAEEWTRGRARVNTYSGFRYCLDATSQEDRDLYHADYYHGKPEETRLISILMGAYETFLYYELRSKNART